VPDNIIEFPGNCRVDSTHRLVVYHLVNEMLVAENTGEFWRADALFVQLGRTTGRSGMLDKRKANAAIVTARICSVVARSRN